MPNTPTPLPGVLPVISTCPAHAGMVSRDHCEYRSAAIEARLEERIQVLTLALSDERRRLDALTGPMGDNGKLASIDRRLAKLEGVEKKIRGLVWKLAAVAIAGGSGVPVILKHLGVL